jgi:hypothetical protein
MTDRPDEHTHEVQGPGPVENHVRMNFEVSEKLRNAFKAKTASQGRTVKGVLIAFMRDYIKDDGTKK